MGEIRHVRVVDAPAEVVFDLVTRPARLPDWDPLFVEVRDETPILDRIGAGFLGVMRFGGRRVDLRWEVDDIVAGRLLVLAGRCPDGTCARRSLVVTPAGTRSSVGIVFESELALKLAPSDADRALVAAAIDRDVRLALDHLAQLLIGEVPLVGAS
jgi:uncharacterized protein YndB with AHSA1/START domain